jgi:hypothetical protein
MAEESLEPLLLSKRAKLNVQAKDYVDGVISVSKVQVSWKPNDPNSAQPVAALVASLQGTTWRRSPHTYAVCYQVIARRQVPARTSCKTSRYRLCCPGQQRAKGKPFLRLATITKPLVFQFWSEDDRDAVVDVLVPLLQVTQTLAQRA